MNCKEQQALSRRFSMLRDTLLVLSGTAEDQIKYLRSIDRDNCGVAADELALEFGDMFAGMDQYRDCNPKFFERLAELDKFLQAMFASQDVRVWNVEALHTADEWQTIRRKAASCLAAIT